MQNSKYEDYVENRNSFVAVWTHLPVMFIASPQDCPNLVWTKERPSAQMLLHLLVLAQETLEEQLMDPLGNQDVKMVLRHPLDFYNILIHLFPKQIPRHLQAVDQPIKLFSRGMLWSDVAFLLVDYDLVQLYLGELKWVFGDLALFFYVSNEAEVIEVLWKLSSFELQPFKASTMKGRMLAPSPDSITITIPNMADILEDFETLGEGLVKAVETRTEK